MTRRSPILEDKIANANSYCAMQVVFVDIVAYSRRRSYAQVGVIHAFMNAIETALSQTARQYVDYTQKVDVQIRRDVVVLPSGDGAAVAFPFEGVPEMHLFFACELLKSADKLNQEFQCDSFREQGWCDCHNGFLLRCGISEGKLILYKDLNDNYNIAGDVANMAARVMGLADANQIFLTWDAYRKLIDLVPHMASRFRQYLQARIKHDLKIDVYQYTEGALGVDTTPRGDLVVGDENLASASNRLLLVSASDSLPKTSKAPAPEALVLQSAVTRIRARMVTVPEGQFVMGNEISGQLAVEISRSLLIDRYPTTQQDYDEVMGRNPSRFTGPHRPVENLSWIDAVMFCNKLSEMSGLRPAYVLGTEPSVDWGADGFRLPTEAEWEYCCRAGCGDERYGEIEDIAWYARNSDGETKEVGKKTPNAFGLHDMLGNVWEWCNDWYQRRHPVGRQGAYVGPTSGLERVLRGGSWRDIPDCVRATFRHRSGVLTRESTHGIRLVLPLKLETLT
jgi:formylglycine-generating enzyme required for sulfatase activity